MDWDGLWQLGGPSQHGTHALAWLASLGIATADPMPADPVPILFLPSLSGQHVPRRDPALRGAFPGLARCHGTAEMQRVVLQGVAFNNATVLTRAGAATGRAAARRLHALFQQAEAAVGPLSRALAAFP